MNEIDNDRPLLPWPHLLVAVVVGLAIAVLTIALDWPYLIVAVAVLAVAVLIVALDRMIQQGRPSTPLDPQRPGSVASAATPGVRP